MTSLAELERFLNDQFTKDEAAVIVGFFEPSMIENRVESYLNFLKSGGIPQNGHLILFCFVSICVPFIFSSSFYFSYVCLRSLY